MANTDIIAIGGSAGSGAVLRQVLGELPASFPGSVLISTHLPGNAPSYLTESLQGVSTLPVCAAVEGQPIEPGRVYVAVPDRHLLVIDGTVRLGDGPRENMVRPSIDPMLRSAAVAYGSRTVGVILSGMLNDGASGLWAVKQDGGVTLVQHPLDAQQESMPRAAIEAVEPDQVVTAAQLAPMLTTLAHAPAGPARPPPEGLALEIEIAGGARLGACRLASLANASALTCPQCQGVLSEVRGERPLRYRCQIGHAFTAEVIDSHPREVDHAVRLAMRLMEERVTLVERMARDARDSGRNAVAELYGTRAVEYRRYATVLRAAASQSVRAPGSGPIPEI